MKETVWDITAREDLRGAAKDILNLSHEANRSTVTVLALYGDLGAGKTTFTQELAKELKINESVNSPTFVIMKKYLTEDSRWSSLLHIDAYRLEAPSELLVLGFEEELKNPKQLVVVEWADKVENLLPVGTIHLHFALEGNRRTIKLS